MDGTLPSMARNERGIELKYIRVRKTTARIIYFYYNISVSSILLLKFKVVQS